MGGYTDFLKHFLGRSLSVAFFEDAGSVMQGRSVRPIEGLESSDLILTNRTIAELSQASGFFPTLHGNEDARNVEIMHEMKILQHEVVMYDVARNDPDTWNLVLTRPRFIEDNFTETTDLASMTKMALARQCQLRRGLSDEQRNNLYLLTKQALLDQLS